jgi:hypothetical protein
MYCPQCKAEYRPGFARCSDCDVDLVDQLPEAAVGADDDPFCSFWKGDDPRIYAEICELLNEEGIPQKTIRREDHLFNLNTKSAFEIGIPFSQFDKAEAAIKDVYGTAEEQQDADRLLPYSEGYAPAVSGTFAWRPLLKGFARAAFSQVDEPEQVEAVVPEKPTADEKSEELRSDWDPTDWNSEDATTPVWSSGQSYPGEIIEMALRENQIHARREIAEGQNAILVLPEDEMRARQIVKEILEGAPPE